MLNVALDEARGRHVLVALSGGADSVALLTILCRARDAGMLSVSAAHFEHGIRGAESLGDAEFCKQLCLDMGVTFVPGRADVPEIARRTGEGLETCARRLRHRFLDETARILGAELIALAHHLDDQAETVLMHLLRGAGPDGAAGMRRVSGKLYRPLLGVRKAEIVDFLRAEGISWREDSTNAVADNPRNRLRLEAIPALERAYPAGMRAMARFAENMAVENDYVSRMTDAFTDARVEVLPNGWRINISGDCEEALLRRAVRRLCGPDLTCAKLMELMEFPPVCDVAKGLRAAVCAGHMYITRRFDAPEPQPLKLDGVTELAGICRISCKGAEPVPEKTLKSTQVLSKTALEGAMLRTRMEGDRISPLGMKGTKSLSDYMTDLRIDRPLRDVTPIVANGRDVLWVVGFGISRLGALDGAEAIKLECNYTGWGGFRP